MADDTKIKRAKSHESAASPSLEDVFVNLGKDSRAVHMLLTTVRDRDSPRWAFVQTMDRLCARLAEEALAYTGTPISIKAPTGHSMEGLAVSSEDVCVVSIMRSGNFLADAVRKLNPQFPMGSILIQRQETDPEKKSTLLWSKFPPGIASCSAVILCDPMLATGGTACNSVRELINVGVGEDKIIFANIICAPEGLTRLHSEFPRVRIVTLALDNGLNEHKYIIPGLGDAGDRYYGT